MNPILVLAALAACGGAYYGFRSSKMQGAIDKTLFGKILAPAQDFFNDFYSNKGLIIDDVLEDNILVNTMYKNLYGIKLEGASNTPVYLDDLGVGELFRTFQNNDDAFFWYVIFKDKFYHRQYLFSYNKPLLQSIGEKFSLKLLSGAELANVILDLFLQNNFYIENKDIHRTIQLDFNSEYESNYRVFSKLARENIYQNLNRTDLYQSYKSIENISKTNIQRLYKMNFSGAIWTYFDISRKSVENYISRLINTAKWTGKKDIFIELKNAYDTGAEKFAIVNSTAHFKEIDESILGTFGTSLKVNFLKKDIFKKKTLQKTPLKFRDSEYDFLVPESFLSNYISCVHKAKTANADFWGFDKNGGFTNYSFAFDNDNPHSIIVANTGAGKSYTLQKIITSMINLNYKTHKAENLDRDKVVVRYFDIGFSNAKLINFLKQNKENSLIEVSSDLANFSYNIVNLDETSRETFEEDLVFSADLVSLILSSQAGAAPLTLDEVSTYQEILREIYSGKIERQRYRVINIKNEQLKNRLLAAGYTPVTELLSLPDEYNYLKKPLLEDVIKRATLQSQNQQIQENDRENYGSLRRKLESIEKLGYFSRFDTGDTAMANFIAMDLNNYKESSLFVPIFVSVFQKTYIKDRAYAIKRKMEGSSVSKKLYIFEESPNYFQVPYFCILISKLAAEARKYGVHLVIIAQLFTQLPKNILEIADTRILMTSPEKKGEYIASLVSALNPPKSVIERLENTDKYEMCIWYSKGVFNLKLQISEEEDRLFNSDPNRVVAEVKDNG